MTDYKKLLKELRQHRGWLDVNPSGAMFCGYSDERTWENGSCLAWKDKDESKSNADRIRAMTDEEMADFMWSIGSNPNGWNYINGKPIFHSGDGNCWLAWLRQEAGDDCSV